jgi:hypothetical protein
MPWRYACAHPWCILRAETTAASAIPATQINSEMRLPALSATLTLGHSQLGCVRPALLAVITVSVARTWKK